MRTHRYRSQLVLCVLAAAGVLVALGLPWYAAASPPRAVMDGQLEGTFDTVARVVLHTDGTTGWDALGAWATAVAGAAVLTAVLAVGSLVSDLQSLVREPLRITALATVGFVVSRLLQTPEPGLELRHGALAAALAALVMLSGAFTAAAAPVQRRGPARA
jgi:hypothetical protein